LSRHRRRGDWRQLRIPGRVAAISRFRCPPPIAFSSAACLRSQEAPSCPLLSLDPCHLDIVTPGDTSFVHCTECPVLTNLAFWPHWSHGDDADHVVYQNVENTSLATRNVVSPTRSCGRRPRTWRPHGQDTRRRCGFRGPHCMSESAIFTQ
jgi:hypothetical protein